MSTVIPASGERLLSLGMSPKFPEALDSSMLRDFVDCPSKFYLRHVLGLVKRNNEEWEQLRFGWGTLWHKVMEVYHKTKEIKSEQEAIVAALSVLEDWPPFLTPENDKKKRSKERMAKYFFDYLEKWRELDQEYEVLRHEQAFDIYNEEFDIRWCGKIDSIRRNKLSGRIVVWDYKTTTTMGSHYFEGHEIGFQFPGYVWAANQFMTDPVEFITIDVMYTLVSSNEFFRRGFRYSPHRIREWVDNVRYILDDMYYLRDKYLYEPDKWVKNWNDCTRYGLCPYWDVHSVTPQGDARLFILRDYYAESRWDPRELEIDDRTA